MDHVNTPSIRPLVSVIVPVYNAGDYLDACLRSIACQTISDIEVVMVNDGSRDGSRDVCLAYASADRRFRLVDTPNRGVSAARNRGIAEARGRYTTFVDADDLLHPRILERLLAVARAARCNVSVCALRYATHPKWPVVGRGRVEVFSPERIVEAGMYQKLMVNMPWAMLIDRSLFDNNPGLRFRPGIRYEDLDFFYRLLLSAEKVAYLHEKLYFYRAHGASFINTFSEGRFDSLDVTDEMLQFMELRADTGLVRAARDRRFSAHFNVWLLLMAYGKHMPEIESRCRNVIRSERLSELLNPRVRLKNKLGALASYGGRPLVRFLMRMMKMK